MKKIFIFLAVILTTSTLWASSTTTHYSLYKPAVGDKNWGTGTRADGKMCTGTGESFSATIDAATSSGGSATQDIMPPYVVVYMWQRTA